MSTFISRLHEELRAARATRRGATMRPDAVPVGLHKEYPRMPRITLPQPKKITAGLDDVVRKRRSFSKAISSEGFTIKDIGTLLGLAIGTAEHEPLRNYPSGGALFPIETYLIGNVLRGRSPAVYHYHPKSHALEHLWDLPSFSTRDITTTHSAPVGSALLIFAAVWERSSAKYGEFTYVHGLLEAGHMAQNIHLVATALGTKSRPIGGFDDAKVARLLDIGEHEQAVYAIILSGGNEKSFVEFVHE